MATPYDPKAHSVSHSLDSIPYRRYTSSFIHFLDLSTPAATPFIQGPLRKVLPAVWRFFLRIKDHYLSFLGISNSHTRITFMYLWESLQARPVFKIVSLFLHKTVFIVYIHPRWSEISFQYPSLAERPFLSLLPFHPTFFSPFSTPHQFFLSPFGDSGLELIHSNQTCQPRRLPPYQALPLQRDPQ